MARKGKRPTIGIEGEFFVWHSLAHVNRELAFALSTRFDVRVIAYDPPEINRESFPHGSELSRMERNKRAPDLLIRHAFPPNGAPWKGRLVAMQPWEYFGVPDVWGPLLRDRAEEVWTNSAFTRNVYVTNGYDPRKVAALPLGFDSEVFRPSDERRASGEFRFLYVGGAIERKGLDLLLEAYRTEFAPDEPVRLIVKDTGVAHVYRFSDVRERLKELCASSDGPRVEHLTEDLPPVRLAELFRSCDCLVQPYRAEGFCLPALEAMACGLPVIATYGGPTDDFLLDGGGWKIASVRSRIPQLAGLESAVPQGWLEPNPDDLRRVMREAFANRKRTAEAGLRAAESVKGRDWRSVAERYAERIESLLASEGERKRPRISLCMIVKDEERVLADCLASAKPWFDEIVVVDTGSTDGTRDIARRYGARLFEFPWTDSFSEARNESLRHATGDWIFWMDADDTLPTESGTAVRESARSAPRDVVGFVVPVQFLDDAPGAGTRVDHVKLFRNLPGLAFEGRIHEQILPALRASGGKVARCAALVLHSGYDTSPEGQRKKRERDAKLLRLDLEERPEHPFVLFNLGMTAHYGGDHAEAVDWLRKCLEASQDGESHVRKAYAMLGGSLRELNQPQGAVETWLRGLSAVGEDPELRFHLGTTLSALGEPRESRRHYEAILGLDTEAYFSSIDVGITGFKTLHNLAGVCMESGDYAAAKGYWRRAIEASPDFLPSAFELFRASLDAADFDAARDAVRLVEERQGKSESWARMSADLARAEGAEDLDRLMASAESSAAIEPSLSYARALLRRDRSEEALPYLRRLSLEGVAEAAFYLGVYHTRRGEHRQALEHMEKAGRLDPSHAQTREQIEALRQALGVSRNDESTS